MSLLLDTHTIIWHLYADPRLPSTVRQMIETLENEVCFSLASVWEIAIKPGKEKLQLRDDTSRIVEIARESGFSMLPIGLAHALAVQNLPPHRGDPFDRLLLAQATHENLTLVSRDAAFDAYGVPRVW